jgi:hypothetical protein
MADTVTPVTSASDPASDADSRDILRNMLKGLGFNEEQIKSLSEQAIKWQSTYKVDEIVNNLLPMTDEYKARFNGNELRKAAGLAPLSRQDYLNLESSYRSVLKSAGMPEGFHDGMNDIATFISNDVSVSELNSRIDAARKVLDNTDPYYKQALQQMYGLDSGHMIAHILDPEAAAPIVEAQAKAVQYGSAALYQGLAINTQNLEQYAGGLGTGIDANRGMAQVAELTPGLTNLAAISGDAYDQSTAESEVFGGLASAKRKREQLVGQEQSRFTGRSNVDSKSLQGGISGQF